MEVEVKQAGKIDIARYDSNLKTDTMADGEAVWHDPRQAPFRISGFPWLKTEGRYRRLPVLPSGKLPEAVDRLADCTAGGQIRFMTDTAQLSVRVRLGGDAVMPHMTLLGQSGFDCYIGEPGNQRYVATASFKPGDSGYTSRLYKFGERRMRHVTLNFPLYQGVEEVWIGTDDDARLEEPLPYESPGRIIVYGTSITQGGCANRPGMSYPGILSRLINREFINLGFSGSGKGEPEVAEVIREIGNPDLLVLDYEANTGEPENIRDTLPVFIGLYREKHPEVPILVLSCIEFAAVTFDPAVRKKLDDRRAIQRKIVEDRIANGDRFITFFDGSALLGEDGHECTVDGIHPTDLGFKRMADGLLGVFKRCLKAE
ncbi:SGNH/GDSL hydrolase family protein [Paenibacillus sp. UNC499MF]|uniref:SGNH/GDSL hydrolase family protein n=1 Tax=Paenibacillus sp. UNC499MF TaxID=1502751 RepID=UPI000CDE7547|nr:SGNH/GDSL hydrolase family protein [Paenibacillus sp. UNC499MF]